MKKIIGWTLVSVPFALTALVLIKSWGLAFFSAVSLAWLVGVCFIWFGFKLIDEGTL